MGTADDYGGALRHIDRSRARAWAMQVLYRWESEGDDEGPAQAMESTFRQRRVSRRRVEYIERLVRGFWQHAPAVDRLVQGALDNWRFDRLSRIDRSILRLGATELLFFDDVPPAVAIHEAVALAGRYGGSDSPAFVNGVLDALRRGSEAPE